MKFSKNANNKICAPKLIFFNEKKLRKIRIIFDIENWLWKSRGWVILHFLIPPPLTQFSKFNNFLWVCWFLGNNLSNFVPPVWKLHNPYCHTEDIYFHFVDFMQYKPDIVLRYMWYILGLIYMYFVGTKTSFVVIRNV